MYDQEESLAGTVQRLTVDREAPFGFYLIRGEDEYPLNESEVTGELTIGEAYDFFLYADRRGRVVASMNIPEIRKGSYGWAKVIKVNDRDGAALDIGISREVTAVAMDLPAAKHVWPKAGDYLYVTLRTDRAGNMFARLATEEVVQVLSNRADPELHNKELKARPYRLLRVGTFLLTEEGYLCFVHESERYEEPRLGEDVSVRIIGVKEDGTLNGSLIPRKQDKMLDDAEIVYEYLQEHGGTMSFGDKSEPELIYETFGMSKGAFKRALGRLYKEKKIIQQDGSTSLTE
ncbi:S1-like domain-containing RNA-binding protein [Jeotgalibacillus sp. ET6]|uniref:CvfB family protein n=1 Tax=Jeotgalibacillus sp. ET6 TaxID=3037260 RepID=UPI002418A777|nr:S1-like domain-containing RNA-binding protein [Jeotgalibacillus sp. ET6]MDG5470467.1 S1-like domain-containing RNA-binding protein [Jeotgalibacillus sp. ET6]